eukprot:3400373-Rhodomonas_salina.3
MSSTDLSYGAARWHVCHGPQSCQFLRGQRMLLRTCYAMPGTDVAYDATRLLCIVSYCPRVWCYQSFDVRY